MSIYHKFAADPPNDVYATTAPPPRRKEEAPVDAAREEAERAKRSKGVPVEKPLPRTFQWMAGLPQDVQPLALLRSFGRIANVFACDWDDPDATFAYFDQLLVDRRGTRKGFPPEIMAEILKLRTYYVSLHPVPAGMWDHLTKR